MVADATAVGSIGMGAKWGTFLVLAGEDAGWWPNCRHHAEATMREFSGLHPLSLADLFITEPVIELALGSADPLRLEERIFGIENRLNLPAFFAALKKDFASFGHAACCGLCEWLELVVAPVGGIDGAPLDCSLPGLFGIGAIVEDFAEHAFTAVADAFSLVLLRLVDAGRECCVAFEPDAARLFQHRAEPEEAHKRTGHITGLRRVW